MENESIKEKKMNNRSISSLAVFTISTIEVTMFKRNNDFWWLFNKNVRVIIFL